MSCSCVFAWLGHLYEVSPCGFSETAPCAWAASLPCVNHESTGSEAVGTWQDGGRARGFVYDGGGLFHKIRNEALGSPVMKNEFSDSTHVLLLIDNFYLDGSKPGSLIVEINVLDKESKKGIEDICR